MENQLKNKIKDIEIVNNFDNLELLNDDLTEKDELRIKIHLMSNDYKQLPLYCTNRDLKRHYTPIGKEKLNLAIDNEEMVLLGVQGDDLIAIRKSDIIQIQYGIKCFVKLSKARQYRLLRHLNSEN